MKLSRIITSGVMSLGLLFASESNVRAEENVQDKKESTYEHSIEITPLMPIIKIYGFTYTRALSDRFEMMLGLHYQNMTWKNSGVTHAVSPQFGIRFFLWKKLHIEYQLWPDYDHYYETNEKKYYDGFDLWNEMRLGYEFDFEIGKVPLFVTPKLLFGRGLWAQNKPKSFDEHKDDFMKEAAVFIGARF